MAYNQKRCQSRQTAPQRQAGHLKAQSGKPQVHSDREVDPWAAHAANPDAHAAKRQDMEVVVDVLEAQPHHSVHPPLAAVSTGSRAARLFLCQSYKGLLLVKGSEPCTSDRKQYIV